ncbi:hypothetical protein A3K55_01530 [Candidatus Shapirobacteria bacterium RBG_13_44_7]|uniref:Uncharacterized protein n=1 Tax=Candidatus Shapirobacteria bacterium RBG_13_44_7 TaxID=1802149 RepID=A0A1F7SGD8_9BACT|nr:MAG: hypothetical protein A3K55_01530 [Candidatus Shapirobacteria bacterium RBG_13_44_7]
MAGIFGNIAPPLNNSYFNASAGQGLFLFLSNLFKVLAVIAGIYMIFQFISAGYMYVSANGDSKKTEQAWNQIWQSVLGIVIVASAFVITSLVERFTGLNIRNPVIPTP